MVGSTFRISGGIYLWVCLVATTFAKGEGKHSVETCKAKKVRSYRKMCSRQLVLDLRGKSVSSGEMYK